ncbi:ABL196Cp [Eremothecium gossypii ATCC 10895]|uniref:ABL196Cp n=1 Tax=Eremothecium gossypii (strain ATCC 10895 / CBS 109.51 / FGSC 9923 / NRRL Y-1056) TaxID=284811 RepID=Q75E66_EREGS|nr:ABL196Cp [Eremothecium gossypii ATCC 10895]AAS50575.1 ABL196Cp [Eremothecium gossypii ATCC 10895]AEY94863.1 FABL196Cp [Eremothecium gossypii FDAG1]
MQLTNNTNKDESTENKDNWIAKGYMWTPQCVIV